MWGLLTGIIWKWLIIDLRGRMQIQLDNLLMCDMTEFT